MTEQLPMFDPSVLREPVFSTRADEIEEAARKFLKENPRAWDLFVRYTFEVIRAGRSRYSARTIFHRIRWHVSIEMRDAEGFKVNNNYSAVFARWFHSSYPEHDGVFVTRERRSESRKVRVS